MGPGFYPVKPIRGVHNFYSVYGFLVLLATARWNG
jgi:hypothetical protein